MKLDDLVSILRDIRSEHGNCEVCVVYQPHHPMAMSLQPDVAEYNTEGGKHVVYLVQDEGKGGYAPGDVAAQCGWDSGTPDHA